MQPKVFNHIKALMKLLSRVIEEDEYNGNLNPEQAELTLN
jgi:hypothetical protein